MDDPQLSAKREEAAKAMSSGVVTAPVPPIIAPNPNASQSTDSMKIAELRLKAQMAMEGEERRKKRDEEIRKQKEEVEKKRQAEELARKREFERQKIEQEKIEQATRIQAQREQISKELKTQVEEIRTSASGLKTVRTLKYDQDNLIKNQNISLVGIAIKEEERRRERQENVSFTSRTNLKILAASLILLILGLGVGFYVYDVYYAEIPIGILPGRGTVTQSLLLADTNRSLDITGITVDDLTNRIKNEIRNPPDLRLGAIENFTLTKKDETGATRTLPAADFFRFIGAAAPESFLRTLNREYMFGILSSAENAAFVIVKTESYDKGFAGLLEWEGTTLTKDLYTVLTSLKPSPELLTKVFEDLLIRNTDTRILKDKDGNIRLVYGFLDGEKTIIIAGSRQAFIEALNRFNTPKPLAQ